MNYDNIIINAQIIKSLDCTTLIYMFFQRVSNKCPYIIPLPYVKVEHDKIFKEAEINQVFKLTRDAEYIYFTFLYLDIKIIKFEIPKRIPKYSRKIHHEFFYV